MKKLSRLLSFVTIAVCLGSSSLLATPLTPTFTTFGTLAGATFGGSGIPNDAVAITTVGDGGNTFTLGLTATQRYANPPLTNNGAGLFTALAGGDVLNGAPTYATWNFDFYINANVNNGQAYTYDIVYDFDPAAGTDQAVLGHIPFSSSASFTSQDSWNLGMTFLDTNLLAPTFPSFNPNTSGEYSFALVVKKGSVEIGRSAIQVNAASSVPEPASLTLMGLGFAAIAVVVRKKYFPTIPPPSLNRHA